MIMAMKRNMGCVKFFAMTVFLLLSVTMGARAQVAGQDTLAVGDSAEVADSLPAVRKRVGIVLAGGGAKGMAHIGVLKVLERAGIPIDLIAGTSMGSIIGGLYSIGWNAAVMDSIVRKQDWMFLLTDKEHYYSQNLFHRERQNTYLLTRSYTAGQKDLSERGGIIRGTNLAKLFNRLTTGYTDSLDFNRLPIPFACVATNIVDNTEYDFHSGVLAEAMRASMAIPGAFTPVRKGDMVLVDGGLRNNYPADVARSMGADYIIGVTVQSPPKTAEDLVSGAGILGQIIDVNCKNKYAANLAITDIAIRVNTEGYSVAGFAPAAIDSLIRRGEEEAMKHWDEIIALKQKLGIGEDYRPARLNPKPEATVPVDFAVKEAATRPPHDRVVGSVGVRFDTEEMVALQLNGVYRSARLPVDFSATLRLGRRVMAGALASWMPHKSAKVELGYTFRHNDIDICNAGHNDYKVVYNHHRANLTLAGINIRNLVADLSVRWDYYNYTQLLISRKMSPGDITLTDDHYFSYHANVHYDSENNGLFPTRGARFVAEYAYVTDNLAHYNGHAGFSELSALWRMSFPITKQLTLQPMLYGRLLFGSEIPDVRRNMIGGLWFGHYLEQQMPFAGLGRIEATDNQFVACRLKAQAQLTTNNFVLFKIVAAQHGDRLRNLLDHGPMMGYQFGYYYRTMFGPVGAALGYSSKADRPNFYINIGFEF